MCIMSGDDARASKRLMKQILQAVQYIHSQNLLHRDLKVCTECCYIIMPPAIGGRYVIPRSVHLSVCPIARCKAALGMQLPA